MMRASSNLSLFNGTSKMLALAGGVGFWSWKTDGYRNAAHEFGSHMLNLGHTNGLFEITNSGGSYSYLREKQVGRTIDKGLKYEKHINRGKNYEFITVPRGYGAGSGYKKVKRLNRGAAAALIN